MRRPFCVSVRTKDQGADPKIHPLRRERRLVEKLAVRVAEDDRLLDKLSGDGVLHPTIVKAGPRFNNC